MAQVAGWIADILDAMAGGGDVDATIARVRGEVSMLCARFPVYGAMKRAA
jgi:glycine hydroxymethyltransferase